MRQHAALLSLFLLGVGVDAIAQAAGTVSGRVLDQSGSVLPGVAIDLVVSSRELTSSTAQLDVKCSRRFPEWS